MRRAEIGLALAAALVFLGGLGARDFWEPDEPRHGAIAEENTPHEFFTNPRTARAQDFLGKILKH